MLCDSMRLRVILTALVLIGVLGCRRQTATEDRLSVPNQQFFSLVKPYLMEGFMLKMVPKGTSMLPTIYDNTDVVTIKAPQQVKLGDIVLAELDKGHYVMHRIVEINKEQVTLKGDHNTSTEQTTRSRIVALVVDIQRNAANAPGRYPALAITDTTLYKINTRFRFDNYDGNTVIVDTVDSVVNMQRMARFNETASLLLEKVSNSSFSVHTMADILVGEYDITKERAVKDCAQLLESWAQLGVLEICF